MKIGKVNNELFQQIENKFCVKFYYVIFDKLWGKLSNNVWNKLIFRIKKLFGEKQ